MFNLIAVSIVLYKWKWGIYCPENYPVKYVVKTLISIFIGKTMDKGYDKRMSEDEIRQAADNLINEYIYFVDKEDGFSPKDLRNVKKRLVKQYGIVGFFTDPWSSLVHEAWKKGGVDEYLNEELNNEVRLSTKYNLINVISHHPKTPEKVDKPPTVWQLTGGTRWWMKTYFALSIHQEDYSDWRNNKVGIHIQKIKDKQIAGETTSETAYPIFRYDKLSRRLLEPEDLNAETKKYNRFPFDSYLDGEQQDLFEGF
jgi:hypothetical protein